MLDKLKTFLDAIKSGGADAASGESAADPARDAAAVLLVKAATYDGGAEETELAIVRQLLSARFDLSADDVATLIDDATQSADDSVDLYSFTKVVRETFDEDERIELVEMMWEVVHADGVVHDHEASLMRRVAGLLYVEDRDSGAARKRARDKLGLAGDV